MTVFDVIVIGAGPAGCSAALSAAKNGCKVALCEEHGVIGSPRHDPGWLMESDFAESLVRSVRKTIFSAKVNEYRVINGESGEIIETSPRGGYILRRDLLEKELALAAVQAGARLYLKTKVVKLIKNNGKVEGVATSSAITPEVQGQVIICADGIRSASNGFALGEALCEMGKARPGISYLLANADVSAGVIEHCLSPDPVLNNRCFFTHRDRLCIFGLPVSTDFYTFKARQDNAISRKISNAYPLEANGYAVAHSGKYGIYFKNMVKDNMLFIGNASGGSGNVHGMIQGHLAGKVAAAAISEKDVTEKRLSEYEDLVRNTVAKAPFSWSTVREDFGTFDDWFREFYTATRGIKSSELSG